MKMTKEHYEYMKTEINKLDKNMIAEYKIALLESKQFNDFATRFAWDLARMALGSTFTEFVSLTLYSYLDDSHINTALKSIVKELKL